MGERLRERRVARRLRNAQVATYLGISAAHLSDMESGKNKPSVDLLARLARYYGTSADYLLELSDDPAPTNHAEPPPPQLEEMADLLRRLSLMNAERLLAIGRALLAHEEERLRQARDRRETLAAGVALLGPEWAAAVERLVVEAVAAGVPAAVIEAALGRLDRLDAENATED